MMFSSTAHDAASPPESLQHKAGVRVQQNDEWESLPCNGDCTLVQGCMHACMHALTGTGQPAGDLYPDHGPNMLQSNKSIKMHKGAGIGCKIMVHACNACANPQNDGATM